MFRFLGLDHVAVTAPEELEHDVIHFYETSLGLERVEKPPGAREYGAWFRAGGQEIHVTRDPHNPPRTAHFALLVDHLDEVVERLRETGCHIEQARLIPGWKRFFTRDPAGNRIEIAAREEQTTAGADG